MPDPLASVPLSAIRVFEAAARLRSFTRAAQELGMTQAAVSWQVKALEQRLDQPLFRRLPREVALTTAGERLARAATDAIDTLRNAFADLNDSGADILAINALQTFATQWLAVRLGAFQVAHPGVAVRLDTTSRVVDLMREEADVGIRASQTGEWPGLEAVYLFPSVQTALVVPSALAAFRSHPTPADLLRIARVGSEREWSQWFAAAGVTDFTVGEVTPPIVGDSQGIEIATALANGGAAMGSPVMFANDIAAGRLVQPFEVYIEEAGGYWFAYPADRRRTRKIAAFRDWLLAQVAADPAAQRLLARSRPAGA